MKRNRRSFREFYIHEKQEKIFEKTFTKYYKRGHWGKVRQGLIKEQQKDWFEKIKHLINEKDYGSLLMAVGHRKNKVSREMFSRLTGINIKNKTTKIIEDTLKEFCLNERNEFEKLKKNKKPLTDEERDICLSKKATWNNHPNPKCNPCAAVWKSVDESGKVTYITNTHRAYNTAPTLKGAIDRYHKFIKGTA